MRRILILMLAVLVASFAAQSQAGDIVHDAEYYVLEAQHGERMGREDAELDAKLAELREKHGTPPNIIHIMWDDTAFGDVGIPAIQKVRGLNTPRLNTMAEEGILFTHMYTEVGCTPSRAASATGRLAIRSGMYNIGMLLEMHGMRDEEVTLAEVLSKAGYATAFHGKWHLGDVEESYPHNQGFDEAFFTGYNQILSLWTRNGEIGNGTMGLFEDMLPADPYKLDDTFVTKDWIQVAEAKKGEKAFRWGDNSHENYMKIDPEAQRRTLEFIERNAKAGKPFYVANWPMLNSFLPNMKKCSDLQKQSAGRSGVQHRSVHRKADGQAQGARHRREHAGRRDGRQRAHGSQSASGWRVCRDHLPWRQGRLSRGRRPRTGPGLVARSHRARTGGRRHHSRDRSVHHLRPPGRCPGAHPHRPHHRRHRPDGAAAQRRHQRAPGPRLHLCRPPAGCHREGELQTPLDLAGPRRRSQRHPRGVLFSCHPTRARSRPCSRT